MKKVLIGIPVLNNIEITRSCINHIIKNTETKRCDLDISLLIIDNGSSEDIIRLIKYEFSTATVKFFYHRNPINLGVGIAWNQILRFSPLPVPGYDSYYDYYVILNNDVLCGADWLQPMIETMETDSGIGWVSCLENGTCLHKELIEAHALTKKYKIRPTAPSTSEIIEKNMEQIYQKWGGFDAFCQYIKHKTELPTFVQFKGAMHAATCFLLRPAMIQQIGYFDEDKPPIGVAEDLEFFLRIDRILVPKWLTEEKYSPRKKWKKGYCCKSVVHHNFWSCTHQWPNFDSRKLVKAREKNWKAKFGKSKKHFLKLLS